MILALLAAGALANGQTTHVWITLHARDHLPAGELRELVLRADLEQMLINGAMFPDGGYAVDDPYGEIAHWEPLQDPYLAWIREGYDAPWPDEAAEHIAFALGMASHGMADQVFDSLYMERAKVYDADSDWAGVSMDEATDVAYAAAVGGLAAPLQWIPYDPLLALFESEGGHLVEEDTLDAGQLGLQIAIAFVAAAASQPELVAGYEAEYPWATAHLLDDIAGAPPCEGEIVAAYWQALWNRLHDAPTSPVLATFPDHGAYGHPVAYDSVESRVSIVFARGLEQVSLGPEDFTVVDSAGESHAFDVNLFYREASHVVHLIPVADWPADEDVTVTIAPGIRTFDGETLEGASFAFSTRPPPEDPVAAAPSTPSGCGCDVSAGVAPPWLALLMIGILRRRRA